MNARDTRPETNLCHCASVQDVQAVTAGSRRHSAVPTAASTRTRAIAYVRVSTDKQAERGCSLEAQRAKVEAYAALYDLELVAVEVDAGVSAKTLDRPALQGALAALRAGEADALLVVKLDRLTRSVRDLGALVEKYFAAGRWSLMSVSEQIDTRTAAGRLVLNVLGSVSQWEREATGERTSAAMQHKAARGEYTGGEPPYGWRVAADGTTLESVECEQQVKAEVAQLVAVGMSLRAIARELERRGHRPRRGRRWHATQIRRLAGRDLAAGAGGR